MCGCGWDGGLPVSSSAGLEAAFAVFADGPGGDDAVLEAAALVADAAVYLGAAVRRGGVGAVGTVGTVTECLVMTAGELRSLLVRAGGWLGARAAAGRVAGGGPAGGPAGLACELAAAAGCAEGLRRVLADARELTAGMLGFEPVLAGGVPYDDVDVMRAAWVCCRAARYLSVAADSDEVAGPATLAGLTAGLAAGARRMGPLLAWLGGWLSREVAAGRVMGARPAGCLAAEARAVLEDAAARAVELADALQDVCEMAASFCAFWDL